MDSGFRKSIPSSWDFPFSLVSLTLNSRDTRLRPYCWTWEAASSQSRSGMGLRLGRFLRQASKCLFALINSGQGIGSIGSSSSKILDTSGV
jgi:hypothetical protein